MRWREGGGGPSVSVRVANYEFKGKIIALGWPWAAACWRRPRWRRRRSDGGARLTMTVLPPPTDSTICIN